mmetsp:Transcript_67685/g.124564  ORF Transcript_67685/g.124564 Transcript_67685/m.124564 type:complete len:116 (-) Transcript_67685:30-377(-)
MPGCGNVLDKYLCDSQAWKRTSKDALSNICPAQPRGGRRPSFHATCHRMTSNTDEENAERDSVVTHYAKLHTLITRIEFGTESQPTAILRNGKRSATVDVPTKNAKRHGSTKHVG